MLTGIILSVLFTSSSAFAEDVLTRLNAIPGMQALEATVEDDKAKGLRRFRATLTQPLDHFNSASPRFEQKLVIFHRNFSEPMVLQTSGYKIFGEGLTRLAHVFSTNQIQVEHRFFGESLPENIDWNFHTVRQSAEDFHRIVQSLKPLYGGKWVSTGQSKGGMTSIFHRRYYPQDVDGTVADVAPISYSVEDTRYINFLQQVGGKEYEDCRRKLEEVQRLILEKRYSILPFVSGDYSMIGNSDKALEYAAIELPFQFWQSGDPTSVLFGCKAIPDRTKDDSALRAFFFKVNSPSEYSDQMMKIFQPYVVQAAMELGSPASDLTKISDLRKYPFDLDSLLPPYTFPPYTNHSMLDMQRWVREEGKTLMFVYGEYDPWSAGAYTIYGAPSIHDNHLYFVPRGNHRINFINLPMKEKNQAMDVLSRWFQKLPLESNISLFPLEEESLEELEWRKRGI